MFLTIRAEFHSRLYSIDINSTDSKTDKRHNETINLNKIILKIYKGNNNVQMDLLLGNIPKFNFSAPLLISIGGQQLEVEWIKILRDSITKIVIHFQNSKKLTK